jgi:hypothetical protein
MVVRPMVDRAVQQEMETRATSALEQCRALPVACARERLGYLGFVQKGGNPVHVTFEKKDAELFIVVDLNPEQRCGDFRILRFDEIDVSSA